MRKLGKAVKYSKRHGLIIEGNITPKEGEKVIDKKLEEIGKIEDIFGSVKKPYISISLKKEIKGEKLLNENLYVL